MFKTVISVYNSTVQDTVTIHLDTLFVLNTNS